MRGDFVYLLAAGTSFGFGIGKATIDALLAAATMAPIPLAILLYALAVLNPGSWADKSVTVASLSGVSVDFWLKDANPTFLGTV